MDKLVKESTRMTELLEQAISKFKNLSESEQDTIGRKNSRLTQQVRNWADLNGTGEVFDSSTVFILSNGARKSPDVSWVKLERWNQLSQTQQDGFPPITPDFASQRVVGVPKARFM